jgi:DNA uptake protein ComE-like DNA-binding protein
MNTRISNFKSGISNRHRAGAVLVIVLWIAFGLVAIALYFANSMGMELRAADNRVSGYAADQAIEGAARYINSLLVSQINGGSNGILPDAASYESAAVPVGDARFWIIGRDTNDPPLHPDQVSFGIVDEASKLNLNTASSNRIVQLPRITLEFASAILDWRDTNGNGASSMSYAMQQPSYQMKAAPFETVGELRLVYGADMETLTGEDLNRNGILDPNEIDEDHNSVADPGLLEYFTVYSREPNTNSDGTAKTYVGRLSATTDNELRSVLSTNLSTSRAQQILTQLGVDNGTVTFRSPLDFYVSSRMTADEFAKVGNRLTVSTNAFIVGRVNVNTASAAVLASLLGGDTSTAQQLVNYRQSNPLRLGSIAWISDALGSGSASELATLAATDSITTVSYQFSADVAAVGPFGRGYRRVKFVFDTSTGTPRIIYRQDLTHLGWALGKNVRDTYLAKATE